jgi:hypothetical protein
MRDPKFKRFLRNFILELVVYGVLVVVYFLFVLRFLGGWLTDLFNNDLAVYAVFALGLVVAQGALLDFVTTFLLDLLKLERLD